MNKWKWIAYGLDMKEDVYIETEGKDINESHKNAYEELKKRNIMDWDTLELAKSVEER